MQRWVLLALLAACVLPALPVTEAQGAPANCTAPQFTGLPLSGPVYCENFSSSRGTEAWTATVGSTTAPSMMWQEDEDGDGDAAAWYAGMVLADGTHGYVGDPSDQYATGATPANNIVTLTSPAISLGTKVLSGVSFKYKGASEPGFDPLILQAQIGSTWTAVKTLTGTQSSAAYTTVGVATPVQVSSLRLRFIFDPDVACDTFVGDPNLCTTPGPSPDWVGWFVDNVVVYGANPPAIPPPAPGPAPNKAPQLANLTAVGPLNLSGNQALPISVNVTDDKAVVQAEAYLEDGFNLVKVPLSREGATNKWSGLLQPTDERLTVGIWFVTAVAYDADGGINVSASLPVAITASNPGIPPVVRLYGYEGPPPPQVVGFGGNLPFAINATLLQRVGYTIQADGQAPGFEVPLAAPYIIDGRDLPLGTSNVTVSAYDRVGRVGTLIVQAVVDPIEPQLDLAGPAVAYQNVSFALNLTVKEQSAYTVRIDGAGAPILLAGQGTGFHVIPLRQSNVTGLGLLVSVTDFAGNQAVLPFTVDVRPVVANLSLSDVNATNAPVLAGVNAGVGFKVHQAAVPTPINFTARLTGTGVDRSLNFTLGSNESLDLAIAPALKPGRHTLRLSVQAKDGIADADPSDNNATIAVEVYLGQVSVGNKTYLIRASDAGFPLAAVGKDGKTYAFTLDQSVTPNVYRFAADGLNLTWDPAKPVSDQTPKADEDEKAPGPAMPLVAAALVALALLRRRKA